MKQLLLSILVIGILLLSACGVLTTGPALGAEAEISSIQFASKPNEINALFYVDVKPSYISADTPYFVVLLSKDGYYFDSNVIKWSIEDLRGAEQDERNYWKIKGAEERLIKHVTLGAPADDKDIVALQIEYKAMVEEGEERYARELQECLQKGDLVSFGKAIDNPWKPSKADINRVCNKYIKVKVVDKERLMKLKYPQQELMPIATYSGKGSFTTPTFTVSYHRLKTSWVGTPSGWWKYHFYAEGGMLIGTCTGAVQPDKKEHSGHMVEPGNRYYIEIIAPEGMEWTFWLEETDLPF